MENAQIETPAEKAKRLGVALIPYFGSDIIFPEIVAVCGRCGSEIRNYGNDIKLHCADYNCPVYANSLRQ